MKQMTRGRPLERSPQDDVPADFRTSVSYIDTIQLVQNESFPDKEFQELCTSQPDRTGHPPRYLSRSVTTSGGYWVRRVKLQQPTSAELFWLWKQEQDGRCRITRVHVALDLISHNTVSAEALRQHIEARLLPNVRARRSFRSPYDGTVKESVTTAGDTTYYFRGVAQGIEIALYSDHYSKAGYGWRCCHLEYRVIGSRALRASGIYSMNDVRNLDHTKFWDPKLRFWRPPTAASLARASNGAAKSRTAESLGSQENQREAHLILRRASLHGPDRLNGMQLYLELRDRAWKYNRCPSRLFQTVDHRWALPPTRNFMWPARRQLVESD
jgi:hypothetical protein